ncbi:MAG: serine hydrolase [Flavobacteriales bacterium]|nr:serine hydrolase [Flavobacteriales bacterium]
MILKNRFFLFFIFCACFCVVVFDLFYLFPGIKQTYLRGETSAQIDDFNFFNTRSVLAPSPKPLPLASNYLDSLENDSLLNMLNSIETSAFLVIKDDSVRLEKYWDDGGLDSLSNSFSIAKSIVSLLVGCAIDSGYIKSVNQSIFDFLPELSPYKNHDVKIRHLLNMSSGFDWLENYKKPISVTAKAYYGDDLFSVLLRRGFTEAPGVTYRYNSGNTQLLGFILSRSTGKSVSDFASEVLWSKIGASNNAAWSLDSKNGFEKTFCCFNSSARDFSKIGLLMLSSGRGVISEGYFNWLLSAPLLINGENPSKQVDFYSNGWWAASVLNHTIYYARGFLGQYVVFIPELNVVFVRLGRSEDGFENIENYMLTNSLDFIIRMVIKDFS